jgi:hypothetical protein
MTPKPRKRPLSQTLSAVELLRGLGGSGLSPSGASEQVQAGSSSSPPPSSFSEATAGAEAAKKMAAAATAAAAAAAGAEPSALESGEGFSSSGDGDDPQTDEAERERDSASDSEATTPSTTSSTTSPLDPGLPPDQPALSPASFAGVEAQIQILGEAHVGFGSLPVPRHPGLSILGARPFAKVREKG